ncbi:MAG TPA: hypothetical protein VJG90_06040 [Candidatus Nanoarchaeia archaeon]|nr:hypothetical protein [Candidatus Nanoarchaeia archaeon]
MANRLTEVVAEIEAEYRIKPTFTHLLLGKYPLWGEEKIGELESRPITSKGLVETHMCRVEQEIPYHSPFNAKEITADKKQRMK